MTEGKGFPICISVELLRDPAISLGGRWARVFK